MTFAWDSQITQSTPENTAKSQLAVTNFHTLHWHSGTYPLRSPLVLVYPIGYLFVPVDSKKVKKSSVVTLVYPASELQLMSHSRSVGTSCG